MNPILYVDLLKQSSYKTTILLSVIHKQLTYFSKKYSKSNKIILNKIVKLLSSDYDTIKNKYNGAMKISYECCDITITKMLLKNGINAYVPPNKLYYDNYAKYKSRYTNLQRNIIQL